MAGEGVEFTLLSFEDVISSEWLKNSDVWGNPGVSDIRKVRVGDFTKSRNSCPMFIMCHPCLHFHQSRLAHVLAKLCKQAAKSREKGRSQWMVAILSPAFSFQPLPL